MSRHVLFFLVLLFASSRAGASSDLDQIGRPADSVDVDGPIAKIKVDLPGARNTVRIVRLGDGSLGYIVSRLGSGTDRLLSAEEFTEFAYDSRTSGNWLTSIFNITSPAGFAWVSIGLLGQLLFTGRMLVQWIASERSKRSVIPVSFWWMSLIGATMLLVYFIWRRDIVGILGQATGWHIYIRNLMLLRHSKG